MATAPLSSLFRPTLTGLVWAALAASAVAWGLKLGGSGPGVPAQARLLSGEQSLKGDPLRLFAQPAAASAAAVAMPALQGRLRLVGMVAPLPPVSGRPAAAAGAGVAMLALDGKPARALKVGSPLATLGLEGPESAWVLLAIEPRSVRLGPVDGGTGFDLDAPRLAPAATGSLPPAMNLRPGPGGPPALAAPVMPVAPPPGLQPAPGSVPAPGTADEAPVDALKAEGSEPGTGKFQRKR
ncbi:MAG: hypothetical protein RL722_702 [Pseudomonadota bacterium]|jgi:general secretion pathway protein C